MKDKLKKNYESIGHTVLVYYLPPLTNLSKIVYVYNMALIDNSTFVAEKATLYK